jgi:hypothetical protein
VLFAVELTDDLDPTALATVALATVALAIVTVISVIVGWIALNKAQSEVDLSRREVEEAHRPVLIPIIDDSIAIQPWGSAAGPARPSVPTATQLVVPIKNIGSGPALDILVSVTPRDDAGEFSDALGDRKHTGTVVGVGVSELMPVVVGIPGLGGRPSFDIWLTYSDVAGKQWVTTAKYLGAAGGGQYSDLAIEPGEGN